MKAEITIETLQKYIALDKQYHTAKADLDKARLNVYHTLLNAGEIKPDDKTVLLKERFDQIAVEVEAYDEDVYSYVVENLEHDHITQVIDAPGVEATVHAILNPVDLPAGKEVNDHRPLEEALPTR